MPPTFRSSILRLFLGGMLAVSAALTTACGPAPGYEMAHVQAPVAPVYPLPLSSEDLAARQAAEGVWDATDSDPSALTVWRPALEGHGTWVEDDSYGTLWVPSETEVGPDFEPYVTAGSWAYDNTDGWTWMSTYDWGWVPFHYGRWVYVPVHGWSWIPGRTYAGAWVTWRSAPGYGYVGWAPMGPSWYWRSGVAVGWSYGYRPNYVYCASHRVYDPAVHGHVVRGPAADEHHRRTADYRPASPRPGRVVATPSAGGGRVVATPSAGARGPRPEEMGIASEHVPQPGADVGIARARVAALPRGLSAASTPSAAGLGGGPGVKERELRAPERAPAPVPPHYSRLDAIGRAPVTVPLERGPNAMASPPVRAGTEGTRPWWSPAPSAVPRAMETRPDPRALEVSPMPRRIEGPSIAPRAMETRPDPRALEVSPTPRRVETQPASPRTFEASPMPRRVEAPNVTSRAPSRDPMSDTSSFRTSPPSSSLRASPPSSSLRSSPPSSSLRASPPSSSLRTSPPSSSLRSSPPSSSLRASPPSSSFRSSPPSSSFRSSPPSSSFRSSPPSSSFRSSPPSSSRSSSPSSVRSLGRRR